MNDRPKLRVLDLFSGIGGFSLGLERTGGFETVAFCEIEPYCQAVLRKHWPDVPIFDDVRELRSHDVGDTDIITGGFPCQDLSEAGFRAGMDGARSGLWSEIVRLSCELEPKYIIVENVADLLTGPGSQPGQWFSRVLGDLAEIGFDAWWSCLRACDLGAPHIRDRVWIVANPASVEARRPVAYHCQEQFAAARADQGSPPGRRAGDFGGKNWRAEPKICRVDDGISANVDRIAGLGNSIIPGISEHIGRAILASEKHNATSE